MKAVRASIRLNKWNTDTVKPFLSIKDELTIGKSNILRGTRIVTPDTLQKKALNLAHATHQGLVNTRALIREKIWFPGIDKSVKDMIDRCRPCESVSRPDPLEPLKMAKLLEGPWQKP